MSTLIETMEKLGSDASMTPLTEDAKEALRETINTTQFPEIKCFFIVPAEDDDKDEQPAEEDKKDTESHLRMISNY